MADLALAGNGKQFGVPHLIVTFCLCCGVGVSSRAGGWSRAGCCRMGTHVPLLGCWHLTFLPVAVIWPNSPYRQGNVKAVEGK